MLLSPREVNIAGIYLPPLLIAGCSGLALAYGLARGLNRFRLSRYFAAPQLVFVCLAIIFSNLIETVLF
ncbi:DUF1656 domain-containing protein [Desulfovibrio sp. TomC]|uniref:DUF1656 domain-containing protein n=1 Tax=Desulfovibrio sp. TomC TaxID=1562888 RepID=UPI000575DBE3|nr:DUF1656 domain-containing protein [Desulfovibrio sp. TomC]KHK03551.1 hypothetical protein NY78_1139 [Desulfovibrio sp. TomC]